MDDNTFWLSIWRLFAAVVATVVLTLGSCTANRQRIIADAIKGGADPLSARCAIEDSAGGTLPCILLITERK